MAGRLADVAAITLFEQAREKVPVVRAVAVLIGVIALATTGAAAASHRGATAQWWNATSPRWSPDGKQVVFAYVRYSGAAGRIPEPGPSRIVQTSSRPGGAVRTLHTAKSGGAPALWAPGGRLVFATSGGTWYSLALHSGEATKLVPPCQPDDCGIYSPIVTPNREYLAFESDCGTPHCPDHIALLHLKPGRDPAWAGLALSAEETGGVYDWILGFSPDGTQLVFRRSPWSDPGMPGPPTPPGSQDLLAIPLRGGNSVPLAQSGIPGAALVPDVAEEVHWSPDGRWVAFVDGPSPGDARTLEVAPTAGGSPISVTCPSPGFFLSGFSWSPTSQLIAYNCTNYRSGLGSGRLMTVRPDGTDDRNLLSRLRLAPYSYYEGEPKPQWSPDGSRLLFLAQRWGQRAIYVWTIRPDGHDLTRIG